MPDAQFNLKFDFVAPGRLPLMWCLIAFTVTFVVTRLIVRYTRANVDNTAPRKRWQPRNMSLGGTSGGGFHLHHVVIAGMPRLPTTTPSRPNWAREIHAAAAPGAPTVKQPETVAG